MTDAPSPPPPSPPSGRRRAFGALLAFIGFLLSPLSWWNDLFINLPLAYLAANAAALVSPALFEPVLYGAYWLTNLLGFVLMHAGAVRMVAKPQPMTWRSVGSQLLVTLAYTAVMVALVKTGVVPPLVR